MAKININDARDLAYDDTGDAVIVAADVEGALKDLDTAVAGALSGSGVSGQIVFWTGASTVSGEIGLTYVSGTDTVVVRQGVAGTGGYEVFQTLGSERGDFTIDTGGSTRIGSITANALVFKTSNVGRWSIGAVDGHIIPGISNTYDIGSAGIPVAQIYSRQFIGDGATSGNLTMQFAAVTTDYTITWPAAVGGAGTSLTDAAGNGILSWAAASTPPAGADTQVQFNSSGSFGASADFLYAESVAPTLTLGGTDDEAIIVLGSGGTPTVAVGQHLLDLGDGTPTDFTTVNFTGAYLKAGTTGALSTLALMMGEGTTSSNHWMNIPGQWRWHFADNDTSYQWNAGLAQWSDNTGIFGGRFESFFPQGQLVISNFLVTNRRIELNANYAGTAANQATEIEIRGDRISAGLDRWRMFCTGNSVSAHTELQIEAPGTIRLIPGGVANTFSYHGVQIEPNFPFQNSNDTGILLELKGRSTDNRLTQLDGSNTTDTYAIRADYDLSLTGATNTHTMFHARIDEVIGAPTNLIDFIFFERTPFGGSLTTFFQVTGDGDVVATGDISTAAGSAAIGAAISSTRQVLTERTTASVNFEATLDSILTTGFGANSSAEQRGIGGEARHSVAFNAGAIVGIKGHATTQAGFSSGTVTELIAIRSNIQHNGAGNVTSIMDFKAPTGNYTSGGSVTTHNQFLAEDLSGGTITNRIGFRQQGTNAHNRFNGNVRIGADAIPASGTALDVTGVISNNQAVALGGGSAPTLGTIGGSGPATAAQAQWLEIEISGTRHWVAVWT